VTNLFRSSHISAKGMDSARPHERPTALDRMLTPLHRWVWSDTDRRVQKLLRFGETETDGGRDILRAAELTSDPLLRRLYLEHAIDEFRHGVLFRYRAAALLKASRSRSNGFQGEWLTPGGHGLDDLHVDSESDSDMLAFLHLSEKAAASRFTVYRDVMQHDPPTRAIFEEILHDETFHMNYTLTQLARVEPKRHKSHLWRARLSRLWKAYLRLATGLAGILGSLLLTIQYFLLLPPFAWLGKRAARREPIGWITVPARQSQLLNRQY
jgi:hypothetical protein